MKPYSEDQKYEVLQKYLCGYTPPKIADEVGVHRSTVYRWIADWKDDLKRYTLADLPIQDMGAVLTHIADLEKQLDEQKRMIAVIHESHIMQSIPLKRRLDMAVQHLNTYSLKQLCRVFEIRPSSLYYHIAAAQKETAYQQKERLLRSEIAQAFENSSRRFGAERIRLQLRNHGIRTSKKRIIRLMKQMGLYNESPEQPYYPMPDASDLEIRRMSRFYSEAYKWSLYEKYRTGFSLTEICEISGVTDKPLREWFRHFDLQYSRASSMSLKEVNRKSAQLTKQFEKAQAELRLFRSGSVFVEVPESIRISCAQPLLKRYGPNLVCRLLKIRKSNLYYHILRRPDMTVYEKHNLELTPAIREICGDRLKRIGAEKIRQELISQGFSVSKRKVLELLREISPWLVPPQRKSKYPIDWPCDCTNILARRFSQPRPNMAWLSDITAIQTDSGKYYLCVVLDLFARRVVAARLSESEDTSLISHTFQDAYYSRRPSKDLIFHSDRGGQYRSHEFRSLLLGHNVRQSFSKPGVPFDNAPMESFFASLKAEEIYRFHYVGINDLTASLRDYVSFYNNKRPHSNNGGKTPVEAENEYFQRLSAVEAIGCAF